MFAPQVQYLSLKNDKNIWTLGQSKTNTFDERFHFLPRGRSRKTNCNYFKYGYLQYGLPKSPYFVYTFVESLMQNFFSKGPVWFFLFSIKRGKWLEYVITKKFRFWWKLEFVSELFPNQFELIYNMSRKYEQMLRQLPFLAINTLNKLHFIIRIPENVRHA